MREWRNDNSFSRRSGSQPVVKNFTCSAVAFKILTKISNRQLKFWRHQRTRFGTIKGKEPLLMSVRFCALYSQRRAACYPQRFERIRGVVYKSYSSTSPCYDVVHMAFCYNYPWKGWSQFLVFNEISYPFIRSNLANSINEFNESEARVIICILIVTHSCLLCHCQSG